MRELIALGSYVPFPTSKYKGLSAQLSRTLSSSRKISSAKLSYSNPNLLRIMTRSKKRSTQPNSSDFLIRNQS
jgi:hypothetical protein